MDYDHLRIGIVSTRLAGTDGVSLETEKWAGVLTALGHTCFYFAGELDRPDEISYLLPEAHFQHEEIARLHEDLFNHPIRQSATSEKSTNCASISNSISINSSGSSRSTC